MIRVYGIKNCPYCEFIKPQLDENYVYIDIGESPKNLMEFLGLRDNDPAFVRCKQEEDLGVPCFLKEDGTVSLKPEDFGLIEYSGKSECSLENKGHC